MNGRGGGGRHDGTGTMRILDVVAESAVRRLGRETLVAFAVALVVGVIGVGASVGWMIFGG